MGVLMRGARRGPRSVLVGKSTVKAGECAVVFSLGGKARRVVGPERIRMFMSTIYFLDRHVATEFQYIYVRYLDGTVEHVPGPACEWEDPTTHDEVDVRDAAVLGPGDAAVVYSVPPGAAGAGGEKGAPAAQPRAPQGARGGARGTAAGARLTAAIARAVVGPAVVFPAPDEWLHSFAWSWEGSGAAPAAAASKEGAAASAASPREHVPRRGEPLCASVEASAAGGDAVQVTVEAEWGVHDAALAAAAAPDPLRLLRAALRECASRACAAAPAEAAAAGGGGTGAGAGSPFAPAAALASSLGLELSAARWRAARPAPGLAEAAQARREAERRASAVSAELALEADASARREALADAAHAAALARCRAAAAAEADRIRGIAAAGVDLSAALSSASGPALAERLLFRAGAVLDGPGAGSRAPQRPGLEHPVAQAARGEASAPAELK